MAQATHGVGGLKYDASKRAWPPELNVFVALLLIVAAFEILGRLIIGDSFLFNTRPNVDALFNEQRLTIIILQVSIVGIIAIGVTQVIITGGIDLSSGSVVGATAMIAMSFAQVSMVNGNPNPKAIFPELGWLDLPVIVPILVGLAAGLIAGLINGSLIAYTRIPPFIATLGMMVSARGLSRVVVERQSDLVSDRKLRRHLERQLRATDCPGIRLIFISLADPLPAHPDLHEIRQALLCHRLERGSGAHVRHQGRASQGSGLCRLPAMFASIAALVLSSKNLTAQAGMGVMYELDAIAMTVIGGVSLSGGRGSIIGTVHRRPDLRRDHLGLHLPEARCLLPGDGEGRDHRGRRGSGSMAAAPPGNRGLSHGRRHSAAPKG